MMNHELQLQTPPWDHRDGFLCESKNVTSFATHEEGLCARVARLTLLQETSLLQGEVLQTAKRLKKERRASSSLAPLTPTLS